MIDWDTLKLTKGDCKKIAGIAARAVKVYEKHEVFRDAQEIKMDLEAVHGGVCPLDLDRLGSFDDFNLLHDVGGIARHLDRRTGELRDLFRPRSARKD
jgi:hypothetical protein